MLCIGIIRPYFSVDAVAKKKTVPLPVPSMLFFYINPEMVEA